MGDRAEFELCRLCLNSRGLLINVFGENNRLRIMLETTIADLIDFKVVEDENYPWLVCSNCMEKLTEFRLFKRRCAECLLAFNNRIQKECNPSTEDCITNGEECCSIEIKKEINDDIITSDTVHHSSVDFGDDMIILKEEIETASECSASPLGNVDFSMVSSMQEGCSQWSDNKEAGNMGHLEDIEWHSSYDEEAHNEEVYDADIPQMKEGLGRELLEAQGQKHNAPAKNAGDTHPCQICYKIFSQTDLKDHMMHEHLKKEKQLTCDVCLKVCECKNDLARHIKLVHDLKKKHQCQQCYKNFPYMSKLKVHMMRHTGEWPYKCAMCSMGYATKVDLRNHIMTHTGERPFKCNVCAKAFTQSFNLKIHMLTHTDERPHTCVICSKAFTFGGDLKRHMVTHTGEKKHKCTICSKAFTQSGSLKMHMLRHNGKGSHKCDVCSKTFITKYFLKSHYLTHTKPMPFKCTMCPKAYKHKSTLNRHKKVHK